MSSKFFYCYSVNMKDFIKSQSINYVSKGTNKNTNTVYFMFKKSNKLDLAIKLWNEVKFNS